MSNSNNSGQPTNEKSGVEIPTLEQQLQAKEILEVNQLLFQSTLRKGLKNQDIAREFLNVANELLTKEVYEQILNRALQNLQQTEDNIDSIGGNSPSN